jgi:hypothetical protein
VQRKPQNEGASGYVDEKTRKQVSGARCQGLGSGVAGPVVSVGTKKYMQNEGASGYVDENK